MRGSFTFYLQDSYAIAQNLPRCATDIAGSFACALVGSKATEEQLRRLFGARKGIVERIIQFVLDADNRLVGVHELARAAQRSGDSLESYPKDGSVPKAILDRLFPVADRGNAVADSHSTHAQGNLELETVPSGSSNDNSDEDHGSNTNSVPAPCVISTRGVMQTGEDLAKSDSSRSTRLGILRSAMNEAAAGVVTDSTVAASLPRNAEEAARTGRVPPVLPENALVITHTGRMLADFYNNRLFPGAFPHLFPHDVGGHLDERRRPISFQDFLPDNHASTGPPLQEAQELPFLHLCSALQEGGDQERSLEALRQSLSQDGRTSRERYSGGSRGRCKGDGAGYWALVCPRQSTCSAGAHHIDAVGTRWHSVVHLQQEDHTYDSDIFNHQLWATPPVADLFTF
ncbi:unnamed protein product [Sphacelaria rigidula]